MNFRRWPYERAALYCSDGPYTLNTIPLFSQLTVLASNFTTAEEQFM